ncbi:hypothetical protein CLOP_g13813 [Closterium sp. NIES-67]|nr:hypothetical protein CLOP_g13813 [Closterium sp. NIES-67]
MLILQEVCDGLDNNNDGKVDIDPLTDLPLTRPCRNPCGAGVETCIEGAFQNCTAPVHGPEVCNGVDDNCDGLVDNSPSLSAPQLDCANGSVCFKGQCLPVGPLTVPLTTIAKGASGWLYYDKGYLPQSYPTWSTNTNVPARLPRRERHRSGSTQHQLQPPTSRSSPVATVPTSSSRASLLQRRTSTTPGATLHPYSGTTGRCC